MTLKFELTMCEKKKEKKKDEKSFSIMGIIALLLAIVAFGISVFAIFCCCKNTSGVCYNQESFIVTCFGVMVTLLVGWNIYKTIDTEKIIKREMIKSKEKGVDQYIFMLMNLIKDAVEKTRELQFLPQKTDDNENFKSTYNTANNSIKTFTSFLNSYRIYIDKQIVEYADKINIKINKFLHQLNICTMHYTESPKTKEYGDAVVELQVVGDSLRDELTTVQQQIETRFREIYNI